MSVIRKVEALLCEVQPDKFRFDAQDFNCMVRYCLWQNCFDVQRVSDYLPIAMALDFIKNFLELPSTNPGTYFLEISTAEVRLGFLTFPPGILPRLPQEISSGTALAISAIVSSGNLSENCPEISP